LWWGCSSPTRKSAAGRDRWRGGFTGNKNGRGPIEIRLRFNTHNHAYSVGLGKWSGDGISCTFCGNIFGTLEGCSGAWQQGISSKDLPGGLEKGEGLSSNRPRAPGQTSLTQQASWHDFVTGISPEDGRLR
jgi:hypothetical protein